MRLIDKYSRELIHRLYIEELRSISEISTILECGYGSVHRLLDAYAIPKRSRREGKSIYFKNNLNFDLSFFQKESSDFYYVLGLWASDGCVSGNSASLTNTDKDVIDWVVEKISYKNKVHSYLPLNGTKIAYRIEMSSEDLIRIFHKYGIINNKSLKLEFPKNIDSKYLPHFIRGVFDGDGSISLSKRKDNNANTHALSIVSGSEKFIEGLCDTIKECLGIEKKPQFHRGCYYFRMSHRRDILLFCDWIYSGNAFGMTRKMDKYKLIQEGGVAA